MTDSTRGEYYIILLQNILLNYCSDTKGAFDDTGVFKQLVSGEKVIGRHPAGRPVEFLHAFSQFKNFGNCLLAVFPVNIGPASVLQIE